MEPPRQKTTLEDLRLKALPPSVSADDTDNYQRVQIDTTSAEHTEPLVNLEDFGIATESFYARSDGLNAPINRRFESALTKVYAREGVAKRLQAVNKILAPYGCEVLVLDGYRPISVQRELWQWFVEQAAVINPDASDDEQIKFALRYCSHPDRFSPTDATTWPTHSTGGAVDLTLRNKMTKEPYTMGGIYLDPKEMTTTRFYEETSQSYEQELARANRRLLFWAMTAVGFVNYPFEWWHFDLYTQASVMNLGYPAGLQARYGLANGGLSPNQ